MGIQLHKIVNGEVVPLTQTEIDEFNQREADFQATKSERDLLEVQNKRRDAYPSVGEQLDVIWHAMDSGILPIVPNFYNTIKAVKDKYPKP